MDVGTHVMSPRARGGGARCTAPRCRQHTARRARERIPAQPMPRPHAHPRPAIRRGGRPRGAGAAGVLRRGRAPPPQRGDPPAGRRRDRAPPAGGMAAAAVSGGARRRAAPCRRAAVCGAAPPAARPRALRSRGGARSTSDPGTALHAVPRPLCLTPPASCRQVVDMPLLFEAGAARFTRPVVVVTVDPGTQVGAPQGGVAEAGGCICFQGWAGRGEGRIACGGLQE